MSRKKDKKKIIPFWVQIIIILVCGILCSGAALLIIQEVTKETHVVTFAYSDGTIIDSMQVKDGKGVIPSVFKTNDVFQGWSSAINFVTSDLETHPLLYKIKDSDENLFYFDSVYVKEGKEVKIDLYLAGKVNISAAELSLEYDPEVITYKNAECKDACSASEEEVGIVKVQLNSGEPITEKKHLAELTFKTKKRDAYSTQIDLICKNPVLINGSEKNSVIASTLNNKIYFLQEVG